MAAVQRPVIATETASAAAAASSHQQYPGNQHPPRCGDFEVCYEDVGRSHCTEQLEEGRMLYADPGPGICLSRNGIGDDTKTDDETEDVEGMPINSFIENLYSPRMVDTIREAKFIYFIDILYHNYRKQ